MEPLLTSVVIESYRSLAFNKIQNCVPPPQRKSEKAVWPSETNFEERCQAYLVFEFLFSTLWYREESGFGDPDNLGNFLVGQVDLICKPNYLDVTRISHVL